MLFENYLVGFVSFALLLILYVFILISGNVLNCGMSALMASSRVLFCGASHKCSWWSQGCSQFLNGHEVLHKVNNLIRLAVTEFHCFAQDNMLFVCTTSFFLVFFYIQKHWDSVRFSYPLIPTVDWTVHWFITYNCTTQRRENGYKWTFSILRSSILSTVILWTRF